MYRVFLVDDEPWVLLGLKNLIDWSASDFFICGEATDGIKAWERIERLKPDLVVSDIHMPGLTGIELIERLRKEEIQAEVIFISGYSEFEYARAGMRLEAIEYLLKPIYAEDLQAALEKVKEKIRRTQEPENKQEEHSHSIYHSEKRIVEEMMDYIRLHYCEITQQELADYFCMSSSTASQLLKKYTGKNYSSHILEYRIQKAQELLRMTDDSIAEIAEKVGYNDYFYFVKVYKKATGISPTAFRKRI